MLDRQTTPMSVVLAEEIADANAEFIAFVETCSDRDWKTICRSEHWSVGVVAHHIAWGHQRAADWIKAIRNGIPIPGSPQAHNASNALKAMQVAGISRDEVIFLARRNGDHLVAVLRSLAEEDFRRSVPFGPASGRAIAIEGLGRSHLDRHLGSIRATLRRQSSVVDPYTRMKQATTWMWALGDYGEVARYLESHAELLAAAADIRPGMEVLDVAAGNGNFAIAAAQRGARVTASDLTPKMLELGRHGQLLEHRIPRQLLRALEKILRRPGIDLPSPFAWGETEEVRRRFSGKTSSLLLERGTVSFSFPSPEEGWDFWERTNPPLMALKTMLPPERFHVVVEQSKYLMREMNAAGDARLVLNSDYLQVVARKAW